ncbi:MAG: AAA family ATPase [candidate division Zixibacteria bacterium]|nr:AAA family ATPase [candidate division Zixibacteria bacterium]NIR66965.1 AAA family ATPase [candidate division Zixibacteria bacterium]NIS15469.1 AAA family ATPase [candidate division Zixibacteria bacterium]NIS48415.1 AAA family ATPase [candidate division Zixibacteria bacterium]NIT51984.1 AAA family ATPase [candidate division Zixibacteria bacterium]
MDNGFSIWILSQRPEIFEWRDRDLWPDGYNVVVFEKLNLLLNNLESRQPDFILLDWDLISQNAHPIVSKLSRNSPLTEIYLIYLPEESSIYEDLSSWNLSGAYPPDYSSQHLREKMQENVDLKKLLNNNGIIGRSAHHKRMASVLKQISPTDATVLITGESGTGKEILAHAIHANSNRSDNPFISVNVAAISESVMESELFGHEKGAFTGADKQRAGYFEVASGGSIFLDEIGDFKLDLQARLLRVLEQKTFFRVGGNEQIIADVRVICATNRYLKDLVDEGKFRNDLYYRLSVIQINTEPLRSRPEDVHPLAVHFLQELKPDLGEIKIDSDAVTLLERYSWPGNVRELKNFIHSTAYLSRDKRITSDNVEEFIRQAARQNRSLPVVTGKTGEQADFEMIYRALLSLAREVAEMKEIMLESANHKETPVEHVHPRNEDMEIKPQVQTLREMEKKMIERALEAASSNRKLAAQYLGIGERTLYRKLKEYGLS